MSAKKDFDCVEMKDRAQAIINERLAGMTEEEELAYWHQRYLEMVKHQAELKARDEKKDS